MKSPAEVFEWMKNRIKKEWKLAFFVAFVMAFLVHMPALVSDIPNHDGLDSMYFDQNMITSGRWFLIIACGFSSFYSLPWLIGVISIILLSLTAVLLTDLLGFKSGISVAIVSAMLVLFPTIVSNFAYVFTMDGYMVGLLFAAAAVWAVSKGKFGFVIGGVLLMFSMGTYQAYLSFAVLLCIYMVAVNFLSKKEVKEKIAVLLRHLGMGAIGVAGYYLMLQLLLWIQGKELGTYQGIDGMAGAKGNLLSRVKEMYVDFFFFTVRGKILGNNVFAYGALAILLLVFAYVLCTKWWKIWKKDLWFYLVAVLLVVGIPVATNLILVISPEVNYHLLMRYQWCLFPILLIAFVEEFGEKKPAVQWGLLVAGAVLVFNYAVTDNIAYSNLQKKYEKTYAYCVRLLDRIEQTPGYYQGIPIAMIGVVGEEPYPATDITDAVTGGMLGIDGDYLLYTGENYELFMKHYLGATLNILPPTAMGEMYYDQQYVEMGSFPAEDSIRIIDGIMYIKTENSNRE